MGGSSAEPDVLAVLAILDREWHRRVRIVGPPSLDDLRPLLWEWAASIGEWAETA